MARTESRMIELGTRMPSFTLPDTVSNATFSSSQLTGKKAVLIVFICNHCPYVKHINAELVRIANEYLPKNVAFIGISSNDVVQYPEDSPELMRETALEQHYPFPYLYDESQDTAQRFDAACTPDFFLYNHELVLAYRGQMDNSRPSNGVQVTGKDLRNALDCLIAGLPVSDVQIPSIGCNIKWKK